jgi:hypothetical protein
VTTAVKVIDWPKTDGFAEDVTVVVDADAAAADAIPRNRRMALSATAERAATNGRRDEVKRITPSRLSR